MKKTFIGTSDAPTWFPWITQSSVYSNNVLAHPDVFRMMISSFAEDRGNR